jgi:hypothetical protein
MEGMKIARTLLRNSDNGICALSELPLSNSLYSSQYQRYVILYHVTSLCSRSVSSDRNIDTVGLGNTNLKRVLNCRKCFLSLHKVLLIAVSITCISPTQHRHHHHHQTREEKRTMMMAACTSPPSARQSQVLRPGTQFATGSPLPWDRAPVWDSRHHHHHQHQHTH